MMKTVIFIVLITLSLLASGKAEEGERGVASGWVMFKLIDVLVLFSFVQRKELQLNCACIFSV